MFTKPHTVVSFPNVTLCEVNYRPQGKRGALSKHNANKKFMFRSSGVIQYVLQKICVWERLLFFSFLFFSVKKRENFYVIETFLELFLGCFILYVLWRRTKINRQTKAKTMPFSVRLAKHRVQRSTKKKKHRVRKVIYKHRLSLNADSQSCLRFACFPQEHQWKIPEMSPDK